MLFCSALIASPKYAIIVNKINTPNDAVKGTAMATVDAEVSFNVSQASFHPHNKALNVKAITIQAKQLGDGSWMLFNAGKSCLGKVNLGEKLVLQGSIGKKIHIFCAKTA